ncbi:MAG TPA: ELM1/GtrOC1 family putative glycosyltransferase [Dongiaceae bacterium]|nr:ELM1/GtrOC1 family putative glycosyltransferase [Dongiaceae bacterium]
MRESGETAKAASRIWLLQSKLTGDNAQVLALGQSLQETGGFTAEARPIEAGLRQAAKRQPHRAPDVAAMAQSGLAPPWPDVVVACGSTPCIVAQWVKRLSGGRTVHVQLGRLAARPERIDLVLETAQYGVAPTANMITLTLPIVRPDAARRAEAIAAWAPKLADLPRPWLGVLVGGPSSPIPFNAADGSRLLRRMIELRRAFGGALLIAYGPRTPNPVREILELGLKGDDQHRIFGWPPPAPNPYPALLGLADRFLVTCDSANMIADACITGKPVEVFMLDIPEYLSRFSSRGLGLSIDARRRRRQRQGLAPDWLDRLRDALVTRRWMTPYRDMRDFLHILEKKRAIGTLNGDTTNGDTTNGGATAGGQVVQEQEIAMVRQRIAALIGR